MSSHASRHHTLRCTPRLTHMCTLLSVIATAQTRSKTNREDSTCQILTTGPMSQLRHWKPSAHGDVTHASQYQSLGRATTSTVVCRGHKSQYSLCMHGLPLQDLLPRLLVVGVVDADDVAHVWLLDVARLPSPPLPQHGVPEHLLRGVDPSFVSARTGYGRLLPVP